MKNKTRAKRMETLYWHFVDLCENQYESEKSEQRKLDRLYQAILKDLETLESYESDNLKSHNSNP